ncbi:hypothetical protein [Mycoplasma todarodis]|uniref:hypothetical protein n=1 Tax=Mycoplasma todarodis TaxID=1937191 RepID=UPI003B35D338
MKINKRIAMSLGVVAAVVAPITIAAISPTNLNGSQNNKQENLFANNNLKNSMTIYTDSYMQTPSAPVVEPPVTMIDKHKNMEKFIKEIDGTFYVGTANKGLMKLENNKLVPVLPESQVDLEDGFIEKIGKTIYIGTAHKGLKKWENGNIFPIMHKTNKNTNTSVDETQVHHGFIKEINKTIYVGTADKGLMKLENGELVQAAKKSGKDDTTSVLNGFIKEINGTIYVGTNDKGLMKLEGDKLTPALETTSGGDDSTDVAGGFMKEIDGVVYVGTYDQGLMKLDGKMLSPVAKFEDGTIDKTSVAGAFINKIDGIIYIGSGSGLRTLVNGRITTIDDQNSYTFMQKMKDTIYVGLTSKDPEKAGLAKIDYSKIAKINEDFIENLFKAVEIKNQGNKTAAEIAKEIVDSNSLGKYSDITIPKMKYSTLGNITASVNPSNGKINVSIEVKTPYETPKTIKGTLFNTTEEKEINAKQINGKKSITPIADKTDNRGFTILVILTIMAGLSMLLAMICFFRKSE